jgi:hypothetical protein
MERCSWKALLCWAPGVSRSTSFSTLWVISRTTCRARTTPTEGGCTYGGLELLGLIEDYRQRLLPLIVPLT